MNPAWPHVPLGELLEQQWRQVPVDPEVEYSLLGAHWYAKGLYTKETKSGAQIRASRLFLVKEEDFVYNRLFAWKGSFAVADAANEGCYVSNEFPCFKISSDRLAPKYLLSYFSREPAWNEALGLSYGATPTSRNRLKESNLLAMKIPMPPVEEQRRIVAKIERLAAKIDEARGLRHQTQAEAEIFIQNETRKIFDDASDERWLRGCLTDYVVDARYGTSEKAHDEPDGVPILRMGNIHEGVLNLHSLKYIHIHDRDKSKWLLDRFDILVNRTNSAELVGKCAVFDMHGEYGFASYLIRIRLNLDRADPYLVARYINSPAGREYMFRERKQMTGQANINAKTLKTLPLRLPPIDEQRHIVAYLDGLQANVDRLKVLQAQTRAELDALLPSILDRAFKGEL